MVWLQERDMRDIVFVSFSQHLLPELPSQHAEPAQPLLDPHHACRAANAVSHAYCMDLIDHVAKCSIVRSCMLSSTCSHLFRGAVSRSQAMVSIFQLV